MLPSALFIACFFFIHEVSGENCILQNSSDASKNKLLDRISLLTGTTYYAVKNGFSYNLSVCSDVSRKYPNASVTRFLSEKSTTILGRHNETDIIDLGEHQILLTYSGGDSLNETAQCNNTRWKTLIFISCDYYADDIKIDLLDALNGGCFAVFHLKTSVCCPPRQSTLLSWMLVFFAVISSYFICGILYKRCSEGAKGWEQVPHHEFWRNPLQHLMGCLSRSDDSRMPRNQPNDAADEPLLRP